MTNENNKPEMRLIGQFSVPVEDAQEGEELYKQLKEMLSNYSENMTFGGQIVKMLEPCCGSKPKTPLSRGVVGHQMPDYR